MPTTEIGAVRWVASFVQPPPSPHDDLLAAFYLSDRLEAEVPLMPLALKGQLTVGACILGSDQLVRLIDLTTHDGVPVLDAVVTCTMADASGTVVQGLTT